MSRHNESQLQQCCVKWFRLQYPGLSRVLFAVPNGGKRLKTEASIMFGEGVVSGVSDLILLVPNKTYHALCIELKWGDGKQTDNQRIWQEAVEGLGYKYVICRTFDEFYSEVNGYLSDTIFIKKCVY